MNASKITITLAAALLSSAAFAAPLGYLSDSRGEIVRSGAGVCWHTSAWKPELGVAECGEAPATPVNQVVVEEKPTVTVYKNAVILNAAALFPFDHWKLNAKGRESVDDFASKASQLELDVVVVVGHTDSVGPDAYNKILSEKRAAAAGEFIIGAAYLASAESDDARTCGLA